MKRIIGVMIVFKVLSAAHTQGASHQEFVWTGDENAKYALYALDDSPISRVSRSTQPLDNPISAYVQSVSNVPDYIDLATADRYPAKISHFVQTGNTIITGKNGKVVVRFPKNCIWGESSAPNIWKYAHSSLMGKAVDFEIPSNMVFWCVFTSLDSDGRTNRYPLFIRRDFTGEIIDVKGEVWISETAAIPYHEIKGLVGYSVLGYTNAHRIIRRRRIIENKNKANNKIPEEPCP